MRSLGLIKRYPPFMDMCSAFCVAVFCVNSTQKIWWFGFFVLTLWRNFYARCFMDTKINIEEELEYRYISTRIQASRQRLSSTVSTKGSMMN